MIGLWSLAVALAVEPPTLRRVAPATYPVRLVYDNAVELRCAARVSVDERGRPAEIEPLGCSDELAAWTERRLRRYRWEKPVPAGTVAEVEVVYVPPVEQLDPARPLYWRHRELEGCELRLTVSEEGAVAVHGAVEGCAPQDLPAPGFPDVRSLQRRSPAVCLATFVVVEGAPRQLELFRCAAGLWGPSRALVEGTSWPGEPRVRPYRVVLQFDGAGPAE
jgi:hypothetical protein